MSGSSVNMARGSALAVPSKLGRGSAFAVPSKLERLRGALTAALLLAAALGSSGCSTNAFCFADCEAGATSTSGTGGNGGEGGCLFNCGSSSGGGDDNTGGGGDGPCVETNGGIEICDQLDNDCNLIVDDIAGIDLEAVQTCGTCDNNCLTVLQNVQTVTCTPSPSPGVEPGTCVGGPCVDDYYDADGDGSCEYYCIGGSDVESICNSIDDDCDGAIDEDVLVCNSVENCGKCGNNCVILHGSPTCVHTGPMPCDETNTKCEIAFCECPDAQGNCWWDLDGAVATGCEYQCQPTNNGVEICGDGVDNDCDGLIDGADDLSFDPQIGNPCFGDPDGECATPAHQGTTACVGSQVVCGGANVLNENSQLELCNGLDDDCDGAVDDGPTDAGGSCGVSNIFPCTLGTFVCQNGALLCLGAVNPGVETCNGVDDNCDGAIDLTGNVPPADGVGPCNDPPDPPPGVPQPCQAGTKACVSGVVVCQGSVGPQSQLDACGVDSNCDGTLTNQPNLQNDPLHCGSCANNCFAGAVHSTWTCASGQCQFQGCETGYFDLDGDEQCEYACVFVQAQETCNGVDDNCNGLVDDNVVAPTPAQVCGVSPGASSPECTSQVAVTCQAGAWQCAFPPGVCNGGNCPATPETCDAVDNNCNGLLNENVPNFGAPCASDDGQPAPGHGACRTTGTFACTGPSSVACTAVKANCASLPGGCAESCDGVDNDCDGSVDETFVAKGTDATNFVKPTVTRIAATTWIYTFEASRPNANAANPGSGNGFHTTAPAGTTLDKTRACSVPGRIPWFNVSPQEVEQTCTAMGGTVCSTASWQSACEATVPCGWGFFPRNNNGGGTSCTTVANAGKFCNLGLTFDFNSSAAGDQDGLLPTASPLLTNCWADWQGLQGNTSATNRLFDMTGNLREVTKKGANQYAIMGGAFNTHSEEGAKCGFSFYTVPESFKFFDTGFRCCFSSDPTL